jgi:hypothetical protein
MKTLAIAPRAIPFVLAAALLLATGAPQAAGPGRAANDS